jgi:hypothetical protein
MPMSDSRRDPNFFSLLRKKIELEPSRDFDRKFWAAFHKENEKPRALWHDWFAVLQSHRLAFASAAAAVLVASVVYVQHPGRRAEPPASVGDVASIDAMVTEEPMLNQLDLLVAFDDVTAVTDDDWKVLLEGT